MGGKRGRSFVGSVDTQAKTARPTSVGPHHVTREQEDPANRGIRPGEGYAAEIARNNEAASRAPGQGAVTPSPKPETPEQRRGAEEIRGKDGEPRDAPPLTGTATQ